MILIVSGFAVASPSYGKVMVIFGNLLNVTSPAYPTEYLHCLAHGQDKFQGAFLPWLEQWYHRLLTFALQRKRPAYFLAGTFLALIRSIMLMGVFQPNVLFFPENQPKYVNVFVEFPVGADIETTNTFTKKVAAEVMEVVEPYDFMVESVISNVGEGTADPNDPTSSWPI